eukprot:GHVT01059176.1.p1 GENE.GHVT01059176.1~~GHVT01059176.1.p1  ORF type:complete len:160 (+),score=11.49 GHVT01059176.1:87-566(+)
MCPTSKPLPSSEPNRRFFFSCCCSTPCFLQPAFLSLFSLISTPFRSSSLLTLLLLLDFTTTTSTTNSITFSATSPTPPATTLILISYKMFKMSMSVIPVVESPSACDRSPRRASSSLKPCSKRFFFDFRFFFVGSVVHFYSVDLLVIASYIGLVRVLCP